MTYDSWKTTNPDDEQPGEPVAECDCCGKTRPLSRCWVPGGLETWACEECSGMTVQPIDGWRGCYQ
jgi:hypothetical protein